MKVIFFLLCLFSIELLAVELTCSRPKKSTVFYLHENSAKITHEMKCKDIYEKNKCSHRKKDDSNLEKELREGLNILDGIYKKDKLTYKLKIKSSLIADLQAKYFYKEKVQKNSTNPQYEKIYKNLSARVLGSFLSYKNENSSEVNKKYRNIYDKGENSKSPLLKGHKVTTKSDLHSFLERSSSYQNDLYKDLKEKIIKNYIEFNNRYGCWPIVFSESKNIGLREFSEGKFKDLFSYTKNNTKDKKELNSLAGCFKSEAEAKQVVEEQKKIFTKHVKDTFSKRASILKGYACPIEPIFKVVSKSKTLSYPDTCIGNFSQYYEDNRWELDSIRKNDIKKDPSYKTFQACIADQVAKGGVISELSVSSSSSQLNNTNTNFGAEKEFCQKGFKELAEARTQSVQSFLKEEYGSTGVMGTMLHSGKVIVNNDGENKNGSSGECPYDENDKGKEVLKPEYGKYGSKRAELDKAKYTKVKVIFKRNSSKDKSESIKKPCYMIQIAGCEVLRMRCKKDGSKFKPRWPKNF